MTPQGTFVALLSIGLLVLLVLRMTLSGRLYVGYAAIWLACLGGGALLLVVPPLLRLVTEAVGAVFPVSAVSLLGLIFVMLVLIYFSSQLTILSNRVTEMAQYIAVKDVGRARDTGDPVRDPVTDRPAS